MFYIYIIQSINFPKQFYTGFSEDIDSRLDDHNRGKSVYTNKLKITLDDSNKTEWGTADNEKQKIMLKKSRNEKLEKIKTEIEGEEIKEICKSSKLKDLYRKNLLKLVELLIQEVEK